MALPADFDPEDKSSWYFGPLSRVEANSILNERVDSGTFLVRDSTTMRGDFVLSVREDREDQKTSHYIINRINTDTGVRFRIGDQDFPDIPSLLNFYKTHYLDTTSLIRPAQREQLRVIAKYNFEGRDPEDLPFRRGDILTVVNKDEEQWWTAENAQGQRGAIPVPYVERYNPPAQPQQPVQPQSVPSPARSQPDSGSHSGTRPRTLPAYAKVITVRIPSAYDRTQLKLEVGEIIKVTAMHANGQWEGEIGNRRGFFPFTHVRFIDESDESP